MNNRLTESKTSPGCQQDVKLDKANMDSTPPPQPSSLSAFIDSDSCSPPPPLLMHPWKTHKGSRAWITGLEVPPDSPHFAGITLISATIVPTVGRLMEGLAGGGPAERRVPWEGLSVRADPPGVFVLKVRLRSSESPPPPPLEEQR